MHVEMPVALQVRCPTLGYNFNQTRKKIMANISKALNINPQQTWKSTWKLFALCMDAQVCTHAHTYTNKYSCIHI